MSSFFRDPLNRNGNGPPFSRLLCISGHLFVIWNLLIIQFYYLMKTNAHSLATDSVNDKMYNNTR